MQKIYADPYQLEKSAKEKFSIPPFLMMENAAKKMADFIIKKNPESVLIICGKGNNGGDGYALARLIQMQNENCNLSVLQFESPSAEEAKRQHEICKKLGIKIFTDFENSSTKCLPHYDVVVDCLYGIGFHGELSEDAKKLLDWANSLTALKIACDIPSALYFKADFTITMGEQKLSLFDDKAKAVCGKIIVADIGIERGKLESGFPHAAFLIEKSDINPPLRKNRSANKGTYGHTTILVGEKAGAGIIAGTAAMNFGSGLTTLLETKQSNLRQFKISPELMISDKIPEKTTAIVAGPGLNMEEKHFSAVSDCLTSMIAWFKSVNSPAVVLDAGFFYYDKICPLLEELNSIPNSKIILTPHLAEFVRLITKIGEDIDIKTLISSTEIKIKLARIVTKLYPHTTMIIKSANTLIADGDEIFICADGVQSLAKGGSGDVLAGMCGSLLAQGYTTKDAAITAVEMHALASQKIGAEAYNLTPEKLIENLA